MSQVPEKSDELKSTPIAAVPNLKRRTTEDDKENVNPVSKKKCPGGSVDTNAAFHTASGKAVKISEVALKAARALFDGVAEVGVGTKVVQRPEEASVPERPLSPTTLEVMDCIEAFLADDDDEW